MPETAARWTMPKWMEPYRAVLERSAYGLGIEDLMNDHDATFFNNAYRAAIIVGLKEAVSVLHRLRNANLLAGTKRVLCGNCGVTYDAPEQEDEHGIGKCGSERKLRRRALTSEGK